MTKQYFKSLYFSDNPQETANERSITIAFNESEVPYYIHVKEMTTLELKELLGYSYFRDIVKLAEIDERSINQTIKRLIKKNIDIGQDKTSFTAKDVTFSNSKNIPFQRWYPYIEGYSPDFVKSLIKDYKISDCIIYDPFAGTGTTLFAADQCHLSSVYSEVNPLLQFLMQTKIKILKESPEKRYVISDKLKNLSKKFFSTIKKYAEDNVLKESYRKAFGNSIYFPNHTFEKILKIRTYIDYLYLEDNELVADLLSVAVFSSLLSVSFLKKLGDVRFRTEKEIEKGEIKLLEDVLPLKIAEIADDILRFDYLMTTNPEFVLSNAKKNDNLYNLELGAIITSPPYLNGTNYFRNTKVELWFLRYLQNENDLRYFRDQALTSGINDVKRDYASIIGNTITDCELLKTTLSELEKYSYDSRIQLMAKCYFDEMFQVFSNARKHLQNNAKILIDIGDSIFCGIHIKTDKILIELLQSIGYELSDSRILRKRRSRNSEILSQVLIAFNYKQKKQSVPYCTENNQWNTKWNEFKTNLPHQHEPFSKKNWGNPNHSLCSYQGKLKPAIAQNLVMTFVPDGGVFLDPFSGVGTIPFEGALNGRKSFGFDISKPAYFLTSAKVAESNPSKCFQILVDLENYIKHNNCLASYFNKWKGFGFNKTLQDYYEKQTFREILMARKFFIENPPTTTEQMLVISALLHILHGNRPYALSRRSHPIVPYAPTGNFEYKSLIVKLTEKVSKSLEVKVPHGFTTGKGFLQDATKIWPQEVTDLDAIITSPPFFDSTRFYLANWIRMWFAGWDIRDFKYQTHSFLEEKQKLDFSIYEPIFRQARERLKIGGVFVLHLGKSVKCDMAKELQKVSKRWFRTADVFDESVIHCQAHGIRDMGTVTSHQYLVLD